MHERLGAGAFSGVIAQSVTYPLDIVRRRLQVDPRNARNEVHVVRTILQTEGIRGLFKGLSMNWVKGPVAISLSFTTHDFLRNWASGQ